MNVSIYLFECSISSFQVILNSSDTKAHIKKISMYESLSLPYPFDCFINTAVKVNPEFCFYVDDKYIQRSFSFQVISEQVLEKCFFSQGYFLKNHDVNDLNIKMLNEIYTNLEESDFYYCFNKNYVKHTSETISAMTKFQNCELGKSHKLFKDLLLNFKIGKSPEYHPSEKKFCENEFIRLVFLTFY